ncbi:MAG: Wzz/FepE/Etk N-terminal domain-containing protein [Erysipelotrichaceae bacterium]|uniref:YveK family protein n=1 Tax=Anaerorhabdus sp. TaxID=1872524 RepID=UPI002FCAF246
MIENLKKENDDEMEIDLGQLFKLFKKNLRFILLVTIITTIVAFVVTMFFIDKKYASEARIYLTPKVSEQGVVDGTTVNSNNMLVNNYVSILKGENILSKVAEELNIPSVVEIKQGLEVTNEANTQIISVVAKTDNPTKSKMIAETTVNLFFTEMKDKLNISNMTILDSPKINNVAVSPSLKINLLIGAFGGAFIAMGFIFLKFILDKRIRTRNELENFLDIPVLVEIPFFDEK